jgi:acetolactate synthase I/II/III large subunit
MATTGAVKGAALLVRALEHEGVQYIFGVPGEENLDLLQELHGSSIRFVVTRHEQPAAFMAANYGRLTGKPGVCLSTLGPGATNLVTGAAYALLGGMPMLMITGQKPILNSRQANFQIVDTVAMMRPLTKLSDQIVDAGMIPTLVRKAFRTAQAERPGPVHLELPEDIAAQTTERSLLVPIDDTHKPVAPEQAIENAADLIVAAKRPLIMLGGATNRSGLAESLSAFVRVAKIPFFNTQMGKGSVSGNSQLFIGTAALSEHDYLHDVIECSDLIVTIGHDTVEKPPFIMHAEGPRVVHIDFHQADIDEIYFPDIEVIGDIGDSLWRLARRLDGRLKHDVPGAISSVMQLREQVQAHIAERADDPRFPIIPQRLVADVRKVMPEDGMLALDNGMYKIWFARNYRTAVANTLLLDNALATMGAGLPTAMTAALLYPKRRVLAICGDGGFMMNSQDLETAIRMRLSLVVLIVEDNAYGMIRWKQDAQGFADFGLRFDNPDFVKYAEAYGAKGTRVKATEELVPVLQKALGEGGVQLVVVPIDYSENKRVLVDELSQRKRLEPSHA